MEVNKFSDIHMIVTSRHFSNHHDGWRSDNFTSGRCTNFDGANLICT